MNQEEASYRDTLKIAFDKYANKNGSIKAKSISKVLRKAGQNPSYTTLADLAKEMNRSRTIDFEFLWQRVYPVHWLIEDDDSIKEKLLQAFSYFATDPENSNNITIANLKEKIVTMRQPNLSNKSFKRMIGIVPQQQGQFDYNEFVDILTNPKHKKKPKKAKKKKKKVEEKVINVESLEPIVEVKPVRPLTERLPSFTLPTFDAQASLMDDKEFFNSIGEYEKSGVQKKKNTHKTTGQKKRIKRL